MLVDKSRLARAIMITRLDHRIKHLARMFIALLPEFFINGDGVVCTPQVPAFFDRNKVKDFWIVPVFSCNTSTAPSATHQHTFCEIVIDKNRLLPR